MAVLQLLSIEHRNSMVQGPRVKSGPKSKNYFAPGGVGSGPASMGRSPQKMALSDMLLLPAPSLMVTHHPPGHGSSVLMAKSEVLLLNPSV